MKVAYLTRIRNEEYLIYYNLLYYYNLGIKDFYLIFNNSNQETRNEVERFKKNYPDIFFYTEDDFGIGYNQDVGFNILANHAFQNGCTWMIPVDADEIIRLYNHETIQDFLAEYDHFKYGYIELFWVNFYPDPETNIAGEFTHGNIFTEWKHRWSKPMQASKTILKWTAGMHIGYGHHLITTKRTAISIRDKENIICAHFPNRSLLQLAIKIIIIGKAFIERFGENATNAQIVNYKKYLDRGDTYFQELWDKVLRERQNIKKANEYIFDPIPEKYFKEKIKK